MTRFSFKEVAPCLFAIFIDIMGFGLVAPLLVAIFTTPAHNIFQIQSTSLSYFYLGLAFALYPLLMFFGTSFIGDLSDIIGRKKTLLLCMIGMGIGFLLMGVGIMYADLFLFLFGRALSGLVSASQSVALATISDLSSPENKAIHLSYIALIQCLGFVVGPLLGGVLSGFKLSSPFVGAAIFAAVSAVWIAVGFEETFVRKPDRKISLVRFFKIFAEAYQNERIRRLSIVFLIMQIGVAFYLPIILILFTTAFNYSPVMLGIFNGFIGASFALGLLILLPQMLKRFKIEQIVAICLIATCVSQLLSSVFPSQILLWLLAIPYGCTVETAFSGMFTSFSNAADATSQGWVMGISVAIMAIAWAITGFSTLLIPILGANMIMLIGAIFLGVSAYLMRRYCLTHVV